MDTDKNDLNAMMTTLSRVLHKFCRIEKHPTDIGLETKMHASEIHTLCRVQDNPGACVTDIARETGVTKGAVSQIFKKLEKKGLVIGRPDPANLSRTILETTESGEQACIKHNNFHKIHDHEFFQYLNSLTPEQKEFTADLFQRMDKWFDGYFK